MLFFGEGGKKIVSDSESLKSVSLKRPRKAKGDLYAASATAESNLFHFGCINWNIFMTPISHAYYCSCRDSFRFERKQSI